LLHYFLCKLWASGKHGNLSILFIENRSEQPNESCTVFIQNLLWQFLFTSMKLGNIIFLDMESKTTLYSHKFLLNGFPNKNLEIWLSNTSQLFVRSDIFHHMVFPCSKFDFTIAFPTNAVCSIHNRFPTLPHGRNETSHKAFSTLWCQQFLGIELIINWPAVALQLSILNIKHILTSSCVPHLFSSYEL